MLASNNEKDFEKSGIKELNLYKCISGDITWFALAEKLCTKRMVYPYRSGYNFDQSKIDYFIDPESIELINKVQIYMPDLLSEETKAIIEETAKLIRDNKKKDDHIKTLENIIADMKKANKKWYQF